MAAPIPPQSPAVLANPNPKERFQSSENRIANHRRLVDSEPFQTAIDYAVLQYQHEVSNQVADAHTASLVGAKIRAVQEFVATLRMLSEKYLPPQRNRTDNLKHE